MYKIREILEMNEIGWRKDLFKKKKKMKTYKIILTFHLDLTVPTSRLLTHQQCLQDKVVSKQ